MKERETEVEEVKRVVRSWRVRKQGSMHHTGMEGG